MVESPPKSMMSPRTPLLHPWLTDFQLIGWMPEKLSPGLSHTPKYCCSSHRVSAGDGTNWLFCQLGGGRPDVDPEFSLCLFDRDPEFFQGLPSILQCFLREGIRESPTGDWRVKAAQQSSKGIHQLLMPEVVLLDKPRLLDRANCAVANLPVALTGTIRALIPGPTPQPTCRLLSSYRESQSP